MVRLPMHLAVSRKLPKSDPISSIKLCDCVCYKVVRHASMVGDQCVRLYWAGI